MCSQKVRTGSASTGVQCPLHPEARVWRDGYYGSKAPGQFRRQRYKCAPPLAKTHVFTEVLPRRLAQAGECELCERPTPAQEGPRTPRRYQFTLWEIAQALTLVGAGASYRSASAALRREISRPARSQRDERRFSSEPHLVADWVAVFAPVIDVAFPELSWPEVIAVDEVPFAARSERGASADRFAILGALGYPNHRVIQLSAFPDRTSSSWYKFFASRQGLPSRVVCDGSPAIRAAVGMRWPQPMTPLIWISHHHLAQQIMGKLPIGAPLIELAKTAIRDLQSWEEFVASARNYPAPNLHAWIDSNQDLVKRQLTAALPPMSTGGLEDKLNTVRGWFDDRRSSFSNRQRTDCLLMLMRIQLNGHANRHTYHRLLQSHARGNHGSPARQPREIRDQRGHPSLRRTIVAI